MDIEILRRVIEIYDTSSISKASENLFISQPYLSKLLKELEKQLEFKLFERTNKGVIATHEGEVFVLNAKKLLTHINSFTNSYSNIHKDVKLISISARRSSYISVAISRMINDFSFKNINATVRFYECTNQEVINNVYNGTSTFGIIRFDENYQNHFDQQLSSRYIISEELFRFRTVVLMSKDHPLSDYETINTKDLINYIEVIHGDFEENIISSQNNMLINSFGELKNKVYVYERGSLLDFISNINGSYSWTTATHPSILQKYSLVEKNIKDCNNQVIDYIIYKKENKNQFLSILRNILLKTIQEF